MIPAHSMNLKKCLALTLSLSSWLMLSATPVGAAVKAATPASDIPPGLGITTDGSAGIVEGKGRKADAKPPVAPVRHSGYVARKRCGGTDTVGQNPYSD